MTAFSRRSTLDGAAAFSRRSTLELAPNRITTALSAARARGAPLLDLTVSNPTVVGIPYASDVLDSLSNGEFRYDPEPFGLESAREAVAALWRERGVPADPARVVMTASTSEAYAFAFKLFCDPGDEILVPSPSYPLFEHLARLESVTLVPYRLGYDGAWFIDISVVERAISPKTRAIVIVSPNNPTGSFLKRDELRALEQLGVPLISDEVFGDYALSDDPRRSRSALDAEGALVLALDGLSKLAGLPQLKLAFMTLGGPARLVEQAMHRLELIADTFLSPGGPVQRALPALLRSRAVAADALRARTGENLRRLRTALEGSSITALPVEGGWTAVLRLPATRTDEEWTLSLIERGVVVQPGYFFDFDDAPHIVVSLITEPAVFEDGVERLVACAGGG